MQKNAPIEIDNKYLNSKIMEKQTINTIPSEGNFTLNKVKLVKNGGLDVHFEVVEVFGDETYTNKYHIESAKDIHPDLAKQFKLLRPIMGRIFNLTSYLSMVECKDFNASKAQVDYARDFASKVLENIEVRGVSLSGKDDNIGVVLTGQYMVSNNMQTCINSPKIKIDGDHFGFEQDLYDILSMIESEVYAFLFKGKKAQLELFGDE